MFILFVELFLKHQFAIYTRQNKIGSNYSDSCFEQDDIHSYHGNSSILRKQCFLYAGYPKDKILAYFSRKK